MHVLHDVAAKSFQAAAPVEDHTFATGADNVRSSKHPNITFFLSLECMLVGHKPASDVKRATEDFVTGTGGGTELMLHSHIYICID